MSLVNLKEEGNRREENKRAYKNEVLANSKPNMVLVLFTEIF